MKKISAIFAVLLVLTFICAISFGEDIIIGSEDIFLGYEYNLNDLLMKYVGGDVDQYEVEKDTFAYYSIVDDKVITRGVGQGFLKLVDKRDVNNIKYLGINVRLNIKKIEVDEKKLSKLSGTVIDLPITIYRFDEIRDAYADIKISSLNPNVVRVTSDNKLEFKNVGTTQIQISSKDGSIKEFIQVTSLPVSKSLLIEDHKVNININVGEKITIKTIVDGKLDSSKVRFKSEDNSVATVDSNGVVTGVFPGSTVIIASTVDGLHSAKQRVTTYSNITAIDIDKKSLALNKEKTTDKVSAKITYRAGSKDTIVDGYYFESEDESIASVSQDGIITGHKTGAVKIYARTNDKVAADYVTVSVSFDEVQSEITVPVKKIAIKNSQNAIHVGEKTLIGLQYEPYNATELDFTYELSNEDIGEVIKDGGYYYYIPTKSGTNTVIFTTEDGVKASYTFIARSYLAGFKIDKSDMVRTSGLYYRLYIGEEMKLKYIFTPLKGFSDDYIQSHEVEFISYDDNISLDKVNGVIKGNIVGKGTLEIRSIEGNYLDKLYIDVVSPHKNIKTNIGDQYKVGDFLKVDATASLLPGLEGYDFEYGVDIMDQYVLKSYIEEELEYERQFIKQIKATDKFDVKIKNILTYRSTDRYEKLMNILNGEASGEYLKFTGSSKLTDRAGNPIEIAKVDGTSIYIIHEGKVRFITREIGSSLYTVNSVIVNK